MDSSPMEFIMLYYKIRMFKPNNNWHLAWVRVDKIAKIKYTAKIYFWIGLRVNQFFY